MSVHRLRLGTVHRFARFLVVPLTLAFASIVTAAPALAREEGEVPAKSLGVGLTILIFVGIPLAVLVVIAFLVYLPSMLRRPRYRPGRTEWSYRPVWVGGPSDPEAALAAVAPDAVVGVRGGGASARW
jgi:hypothetical protein